MTRCVLCGRKVASMPTADCRNVVIDVEQPVYAPVEFGERRQLVRTEMAVAQHLCSKKTSQ